MAAKDFRELKVWAKAHEVALQVYQVTKLFPKDEIYGLTNQIRRSSVSVGSNIAEGCGRGRQIQSNIIECKKMLVALSNKLRQDANR
ncbi:MAG: four helix bundle protein [Anaerolineae bacterium]|nr:four helix bundle protein [Anaerolineae bacterium]